MCWQTQITLCRLNSRVSTRKPCLLIWDRHITKHTSMAGNTVHVNVNLGTRRRGDNRSIEAKKQACSKKLNVQKTTSTPPPTCKEETRSEEEKTQVLSQTTHDGWALPLRLVLLYKITTSVEKWKEAATNKSCAVKRRKMSKRSKQGAGVPLLLPFPLSLARIPPPKSRRTFCKVTTPSFETR